NRFQEIFANVGARYDAENRAARTVSESIRVQIAAHLSNAPHPLAAPICRPSQPHHARMVAYKSSAVASFVKTPKPECRAVLVYGPDAGLVAERAAGLARVFA